MSKTRRQRALEHPAMPKPGVRDPRRIKQDKPDNEKDPSAVAMGKKGGAAPHKLRGLQAVSPSKRKLIAQKANQTKRANKQALEALGSSSWAEYPVIEATAKEPVTEPITAPPEDL